MEISGAYLNADMTMDMPGHMRLDRIMTDIIIDIDPKYGKYADARGGGAGVVQSTSRRL